MIRESLLARPRLIGDPIMPGRPGMLTAAELVAVVEILTLVESRRVQALESMEWPELRQRVLGALERGGYVRNVTPPRGGWCHYELTETGRTYLHQLPQRNPTAT